MGINRAFWLYAYGDLYFIFCTVYYMSEGVGHIHVVLHGSDLFLFLFEHWLTTIWTIGHYFVKFLGIMLIHHTSWVAIVTPADRPKSVRNRCVIEVFGGVFCVVTLLFGFFCRCKGFCHRAESDLFLFSFSII